MYWQPLTDHWDKYEERLQEAADAGLLDDPEEAQEIIYPEELYIGEGEKDDVREFITDRLNELYSSFDGDFDPNILGTYIFRALMLGMVWERERIGL
jgi:hypothetical protein